MRKNRLKMRLAAMAMLSLAAVGGYAQDKVETSVGADVVSGYVWRGQDLGDVSLQPSLTVAYKGLSLSAWGNVGVDKEDTKEVDLTLGYAVGGFSISVTDYWTDGGAKYFHYGAHDTNHVFEAQVGYDFGVVAVNWFTNFAGADGVKANGKRAYSSYISLAAPFKLGGVEWTAEVGATPWETDYYNEGTTGFAVCDLSLEAAKEIQLSKTFSLPLFAKLGVNPRTEDVHFVVGLSF